MDVDQDSVTSSIDTDSDSEDETPLKVVNTSEEEDEWVDEPDDEGDNSTDSVPDWFGTPAFLGAWTLAFEEKVVEPKASGKAKKGEGKAKKGAKKKGGGKDAVGADDGVTSKDQKKELIYSRELSTANNSVEDLYAGELNVTVRGKQLVLSIGHVSSLSYP